MVLDLVFRVFALDGSGNRWSVHPEPDGLRGMEWMPAAAPGRVGARVSVGFILTVLQSDQSGVVKKGIGLLSPGTRLTD